MRRPLIRRPLIRRPLMRLPLLLAAALVVAVGCDEQVPGSAPTGDGRPVLPQGGPATPAPVSVATPLPPPSLPPVATPTPRPVAPASNTPGPMTPAPDGSASPSPTPSPSGSASPGASPTPAPTPSGPFTKTQVASDLAVSGPAYFVLATKPFPTGTQDLLFTRHGKFRLKAETQGSVPVLRLRHADHGFLAVGFQTEGEPAAPPLETVAEDFVVLATSWGGRNVAGVGLTLDAQRNPQASAQLAFDFTGRLTVEGAAPRGADGTAAAAYVALAQFDSPDRLVPLPGFPGIFRYEVPADEDEDAPEPAMVRLGVAVSGTGRPVGNANLVVTGSLERL